MKYKFIFIVSLFSIHFNSIGQTSDTISKSSFDTLVLKSFTKIVTGQTDIPNLSNYAAFTPTDGKFTFNGYANISKRSAISLSASGGLIGNNNNIGSLFSDGKVSTNTDINCKLHFRLDKPTIQIDMIEMTKFTDKKNLMIKDRNLAIVKSNNSLNNLQIELSRTQLALRSSKQKNDSLVKDSTRIKVDLFSCLKGKDTICAIKKLDTLKTVVTDIQSNQQKIYSLTNQIDSILKIARLDRLIIDTSLKLKTLQDTLDYVLMVNYGIKKSFRYTMDSLINKEYDDKIKELEKNIKIPAWNMTWLTIGTNWNNKKYRTFTPSLLFDEQLKKQKFNAFNIGAEFNKFHFDELFRSASFLNVGIIRKKNNNLDDLTTTKLSDEDTITSGNTSRKLVSTYDVYTDSVEVFKLWNLYANYYWMFGKNISSGIHLFSDIEFRQTNQTVWNSGFGYIFGFNNKVDNRLMNTELFLKFVDITSTLESERKTLWDHAQMGISISFPFILLINKK